MVFGVSISVEVYGTSIMTLPSLPDAYTYYFYLFGTALMCAFQAGRTKRLPGIACVLAAGIHVGLRNLGDGVLMRQRKTCTDCPHLWRKPQQLQNHSLRCTSASVQPLLLVLHISFELSNKNISFPTFFLLLAPFFCTLLYKAKLVCECLWGGEMNPRKQRRALSAAPLARRAGGSHLLLSLFAHSPGFHGQEMLVVSPRACPSVPPTRQLGRAEDRA